jgi:diguanylate cyclase (GGDEF)-like protein/PAS domain S-box-containing protein
MTKPLNILIVEDSQDDCDLLLLELSRAGYVPHYERVETDAAMTAALDRQRWDAIVSDYSLPRFNGVDALRLLRSRDPDTPFILVSGTVGERAAVAAMKAGADDYLMKGDMARFLPALERGLRDAEARRERRIAEERLKISAMVFKGASEGIVITDARRVIIEVNDAFTSVTGYTIEEVLGKTPELLGSGLNDERFCRTMLQKLARLGHWEEEVWNTRKNGEVYPAWLSITVLRNERRRISHYVGMVADITALKDSQKRLAYLASYDVLTGLPNRSFFNSRLQHAIEAANRRGYLLAVLFVDLDNFKMINDTLGHDNGDRLLVEMANRLKNCIRQEDTLARLGGDEFTVLLENMRDAREGARTAERLVQAASTPFRLSGREVFVSASIGISVFPTDGQDLLTLMKNADTAMYKVKEQGRNSYQFFTEAMNVAVFERLFVEMGLRRAIANQEFFLLYQPAEEIKSGRVVWAEALIRWRHPVLGEVPPVKFIPIAEQAGLIDVIGEWVLKAVCVQLKSWSDAGLYPLRIAVNCSGRQFRGEKLHQSVSRALHDAGITGELLTLELTESAVMEEPEQAIKSLGELKQMGVRISIDDFGTGYSSLSHLKRFPLDRLKIDRSFVRDIAIDQDDAAITDAIIALGHGLGLTVVAEGVETAEQLESLKSRGCDEMQGFYCSRPLPPEEFQRLLCVEYDTSPL